MKSFKNHLSLVIALVSILFTIQVFTVVDRSIDAYKDKLTKNYSLVIVSQNKLLPKELKAKVSTIADVIELSPESVIKKLNTKISKNNIELLKATLPRFYKLKLAIYPSPDEIQKIRKKLLKIKSITKVESFSATHDTIYNLLLLFKTVISVLAFAILIVTVLLIFKELRIWQFKHNERMNIMSLFGAPTWLRSAVLFRLAIVDALIASVVNFGIFSYIASSSWVSQELKTIGIHIVVFDKVNDFLSGLAISVTLSILLAAFIVLGHKEEV
ncbi:cell division protein FtsX [Sulfurimonas sp.]|uniref:cell division protein FtsX n=1 Tax=Sulfurimonas sp. TaxID=2022749 RepID=UPI002621B4F7|nr:cell division protein FtsX [Sulfurimonas sp.]